MLSRSSWRRGWDSEGGPGEVLALALPLVLSMGSWTIQIFVDRLFLTWYTQAAIAAAVPAMCVLWVFMGTLQGVVGFVTTFVAQYHGAGQTKQIGPAVGQSMLVAVIGGVAIQLLYPLARPLFVWVGHEPDVVDLEVVYFRIMLFGAVPTLVTVAASSFFSGLGRTWVVLWLNVVTTIVNVVLDYGLIFGHWGLPRLGIGGAAWGTVLAYVVTSVLALILIWCSDADGEFRVRDRASWRPDVELLRRLLRYGGPNGVMALVDILAWTWFVLLVGRLGTRALAATNVALNINMIAFMPMVGISTAVQTLVGRRLGENRPELAARSTWTAFSLATLYTIAFGAAFVLMPQVFLAPFEWQAPSEESAELHGIVLNLLRFIPLYMLFDTASVVFCGALRGAGDTWFVMGLILVLSAMVLGIPSYFACEIWGAGIYAAWSFATAYVLALGVASFARFRWGPWWRMRVIETKVEGVSDHAECLAEPLLPSIATEPSGR